MTASALAQVVSPIKTLNGAVVMRRFERLVFSPVA
jgi:hypothetical protein